MAHTLSVQEYWSPRQLNDHQALSNHDSMLNGTGLTGFFISGVSDAADTGVTDTGEFFSVADANIGASTDEPEWSTSTTPPQWLNQDSPPDTLPVTVIGRTQEDAASNSVGKQVSVPAGDFAAIYLSEIEHITTDHSYTVPAGDWTARLYVSTANARIYIYKVVVMKVGWYGYSGNLVFGGPGTSVIYTHTETAPFTTLGSTGTYSVNFTTTSDTTIDPTAQSGGGAAEKLVVMFIVGNSTRGDSPINFRHNRNILTPIPRVQKVSLDAAQLTLDAQSLTVTVADLTRTVSPVSLSLSAQTPTRVLGGLTRSLDAQTVALVAQDLTRALTLLRTVDAQQVAITVLPVGTPPREYKGTPTTIAAARAIARQSIAYAIPLAATSNAGRNRVSVMSAVAASREPRVVRHGAAFGRVAASAEREGGAVVTAAQSAGAGGSGVSTAKVRSRVATPESVVSPARDGSRYKVRLSGD